MSRTIALLTDFGLDDPYVGQMKGVLATHAPKSRIIDVTHGVEPFCISQGAFFLAAAMNHFPEDTIFITVVDPGVGSDRKIVGLQLDERVLIAPDNGLLALALKTARAAEVRAFDLSEATSAPDKVSNTFHGRDVFAPLAAWVALGGNMAGFGKEIDPASLIAQPWSLPIIIPGSAHAHVLHIDRFGNCVLNLETGSLGTPKALQLTSPSSGAITYAKTYADVPEGAPSLLEGSQGFLEIAVNQHSAAKRFGLSMGDAVELKWEI